MERSTVQLTTNGKKEMQTRILKLEKKIGKLHDSIERAIRQFGTHDTQYHERLELKKIAEQERSHLLTILSNSKIVSQRRKAPAKINIGCKVTLVDKGLQSNYQVVETVEANPMEGRISVQSPLGKSLLGKGLGDLVRIVSPAGMRELEVSAIR